MDSSRLWQLLTRKYNNEISADEQKELEELLREHKDVFELNETFSRLKDLEVQQLGTAGDEEKSRQSIAARITLTPPPRPYRKKLLRSAVLSCILIAGGLLIYQLRTSRSPLSASQNEVVTGISKSRIKLPDGSMVILNRQSRLTYNKDFGIGKREIALTGEAYFDIAKNEAVPLTVVAGPVQIRVLGTAFNVRAYSDDSTIETSLIRGSIEISSADDPDRRIPMRPNEKIVFGKNSPSPTPAAGKKNMEAPKPAQVFVVMNRIKPNPIDSSINEIVWVQDKLVFSKEPFYSLAQKMERWFQVRIQFKDKISEQLSLTGSLEKESLTEALDALQQLTPFKYQIEGGIVTISK